MYDNGGVTPILPRALALPDFPWDSLRPYRVRAARHPGGVVDLAVGTPVDESPDVARAALAAASDAPGYPATVGTSALREAVIGWMERRRGVAGLSDDAVIPTIGSKESVALLPLQLGAGPGDIIVHPRAAYPTYDVGARLAGATPVPVDTDADPDTWNLPAGRDDGPAAPVIVWLNSPGNPDGHVLGIDQLARVVVWARRRGAVVVSDECYAELAWAEPWATEGVPSLLDPRVAGARDDGSSDLSGLVCLYSLSKQSNLAGYRAAFLAGDPAIVGALTQVRKHSGMLMPAPVQAAMVAALGDDAHVAAQREIYRRRGRPGERPRLGGRPLPVAERAEEYERLRPGGGLRRARHRRRPRGLLRRGGRRAGAHEPDRHRRARRRRRASPTRHRPVPALIAFDRRPSAPLCSRSP